MKEQAKHTATPWKAWGLEVVSGVVQTEDEAPHPVAYCDRSWPHEICKANAAFIVRACNAHHDLVAALKEYREALALAGREGVEIPDKVAVPLVRADCRARAAIAKAEA